MAAGSRDLASSLFPFLSVLACTIGTLTLLIATLALNQVAEGLEARDPDAPVPPELATLRAQNRALLSTLASAENASAESAAVSAELRALGISQPDSQSAVTQHVSARLASARRQRQLAALRREASELDAAVAGLTSTLEAPRPRDDHRAIRIHPEGRGNALRPFFVECRREGVRIFHEGLGNSLFLDRKSRHGKSQFEIFLRRARSLPNHTVLFLIRPDGVETYDWAAATTTNLSVRHAKLPLPGYGEIEFAL